MPSAVGYTLHDTPLKLALPQGAVTHAPPFEDPECVHIGSRTNRSPSPQCTSS